VEQLVSGYGNIFAVTQNGRIATMLYSLLGIPLTLSILNDWGNMFYSFALSFWSVVGCCRICQNAIVR
jgi:hypothetical protein